ncbi:SDR family oxidoreductase [Microbacterium sp. NPDC058342]|uniref:SDR family oxidoreductase n=1 Tax=Microbacterium sp. NPDC058342 TaxID=3346454 RepID=UPI003663C028
MSKPDSGVLAGRTAVVTGASSGIGAAVVRRLLDAGAAVHGLARREGALNSVAPEHRESGRFTPHVVDVSDTAALETVMARIERSAPADILVLAAGTNIPQRRFAELTADSFDHVIQTNLHGVFNTIRVALPQLRDRAGDVVIISSIAASWPDHSGAAYGASKAALLGLARGLSRDEHRHGVRVCTVLPGIVDTEILDKRPVPPPREVRDLAVAPEDLAEAVLTVVSLPNRTNIAEISVVATRLQAFSGTQDATPMLPESAS